MRARLMGFALLAVSIGAMNGRAQDKVPVLSRNDLDNLIVKIVYDSAVLGTDIYNKGHVEGCFRLYQGTLIAVQPLLKDYRAKLALSVKDKMDRAKTMKVEDGAFILRAALDEIQNEIAPPAAKTEKIEKVEANKTLWDRLGGTGGVEKILKQVFIQAVEDSKVNLFRGKKLDDKAQASLRQSLLEFISSVTGGPHPYKGKDMKAAHAGMKITDDEFNALGKIVQDTLRANKIAEADIKEFMGLLETTRKDIVEVKGKN
jgi:hemoglobin